MADVSPKFHAPELLPHAPAADLAAGASHDGLCFWQFMAAGSVAGVVEHTAMFPVDTLKTRMQAQGASSCRPVLGVRHALASILRQEGPLGLYRGIGAMGLGAGPAHAVYFSVYEAAKEVLSRGNPNNPVAHASSGVVVTVASDAVFTPMDTVKQRLQLKSSPYKGVADCVRRVLREEGCRAFYASYRTTVVMNAPFTAAKTRQTDLEIFCVEDARKDTCNSCTWNLQQKKLAANITNRTRAARGGRDEGMAKGMQRRRAAGRTGGGGGRRRAAGRTGGHGVEEERA